MGSSSLLLPREKIRLSSARATMPTMPPLHQAMARGRGGAPGCGSHSTMMSRKKQVFGPVQNATCTTTTTQRPSATAAATGP